MFNRFIRAMFGFSRQTANRSAAWAMVARDIVSGFLTTAHHALMILGISAIAAWCVMFIKPEIVDHIKALPPFAEAEAEEVEMEAPALTNLMNTPAKSTDTDSNKIIGTPLQHQWITAWLSKRYRVASDATDMLVSAAYLTANEIKLDPLLILAVMAIESGFNPFAESPVGAQGLMQVMSKIHHEKFEDLGGVKAALNPVTNIKVGSLILKDYVKRGGSVEAGLKLYVGAAAFENDSGYGARVLAEYRRLKDVSLGKKVPIFSTSANSAAPKVAPIRKSGAPTENEATEIDAKLSRSKTERVAAL